jgi:nucleoid DNA-binding protein
MPAPLEEYISELLYEHECVVVPGFGGFIGNYSPARIDPVKQLFEPPRKNILFNKGLVQNDGLLAHHIANARNIPYTEALAYIASEVRRIQSALQQHKRITLDGIGLLYTDEHGALLFQPDDKVNYLQEAFGLSAFYRLPAAATAQTGKVVPLHNTGYRLKTLAAAAAIGAFLASAAWLSFNTRFGGIDYSSLNIFAKKEVRHYKSITYPAVAGPSHSRDSINSLAILNTQVTSNLSNASSEGAAAAGGSYLIVAGCFRYLSNAQSLVTRMQQKQLNASIIGTNLQGLYMVGYGNYGTREDAENQLAVFRKNYVADAWVCSKPAPAGENKRTRL